MLLFTQGSDCDILALVAGPDGEEGQDLSEEHEGHHRRGGAPPDVPRGRASGLPHGT